MSQTRMYMCVCLRKIKKVHKRASCVRTVIICQYLSLKRSWYSSAEKEMWSTHVHRVADVKVKVVVYKRSKFVKRAWITAHTSRTLGAASRHPAMHRVLIESRVRRREILVLSCGRLRLSTREEWKDRKREWNKTRWRKRDVNGEFRGPVLSFPFINETFCASLLCGRISRPPLP